MRLSERDQAVIRDINRFRVMDRDTVAELHFSHLKRPVNSANAVLKRLVANGNIRRSDAFGTPFLYLSADSKIKKDSSKIGHYLAILGVYKEMLRYGDILQFQVEPRFGGKGTVEPDVFCIFRKHGRKDKAALFIEVQKTVYSQRTMQSKLERYLQLYESDVISKEPWQPENKPSIFPRILILSEQRFALDSSYPFSVIQAPSFGHLIESLKSSASEPQQPIQSRSEAISQPIEKPKPTFQSHTHTNSVPHFTSPETQIYFNSRSISAQKGSK